MSAYVHPRFTRRAAIQAGAVGLFGLGVGELNALRAADAPAASAKSVIFLFLSGGLGQHDSFDPKPNAPADIRGEFGSIPTRTPGVRVCEHFPLLADRSDKWAVVRSLTHKVNEHSGGHHIMLTGRSELPPGFSINGPKPTDHPSIASVVTATAAPRNNLPPAVMLPDKLVHRTGAVVPGQFAAVMGAKHDPWFLELSPFEANAYGAYPEYEFDHLERPFEAKRKAFVTPQLSLPDEVSGGRFDDRLSLLKGIDGGRRALDSFAAAGLFGKSQTDAASLLTAPNVRRAFDVGSVPPRDADRYGRNAFGWSCLLAGRLVEAGVRLVQVNLGNNETWDTHGNAFPHLKDKLMPPTDKAVSALLDDLEARGLLDSTLIVMAGEFGRTPKVSTIAPYKGPGRDHWGAVQSLMLAGGGVKGGTVIGSSDKNGAYPSEDPQTPENLAATIYSALGLPKETAWTDAENRPHFIYHGEPIKGL